MTREELFFKYACECKDTSCLPGTKKKCAAEFYRDLDSVIENEKSLSLAEKGFIDNLKTYGDLFTAEIIGKCVAEFVRQNGELSSEGKSIVQQLIADRTTMNPKPDFSAENEFVERLKGHAKYMTIEQLSQLVESWIMNHGTLTFKNGELVRQILNEVQRNENINKKEAK